MRKSIYSFLAAGLIFVFSFGGSLAWAGGTNKDIPLYLQKKVLAACQQATERGLMAQVNAVDRDTLIALVQAPCQRVRTVAIYTLGAIREPRAVRPLVAVLNGPDPRLRRVAAHALGKIGRPEAAGPLAALMEDHSQPELVRCTAACALGHLQGQQAAQALRQAAQSCSGRLQLVASMSLERQAMATPSQVAGN